MFHQLVRPAISASTKSVSGPPETLDAIGLRHGTDKASNQNNYLAFYAQFFDAIRGRQMRILDIGVLNGGSCRMWRDYFPNSHIIGVDINPDVRKFAGDRLSIHIADQSKPADLEYIVRTFGPLDVVIDDGSHVWDHQILTFKYLMPCTAPGGFYVLEDLDTSYGKYVATYKQANTFGVSAAEYLKQLSDCVIGCRVLEDGEHSDPDIRAIWPIVDFVAFSRGTALIKRLSQR